MRAATPLRDGYAERDGVKLHFEVYGEGDTTILLMPTWALWHARHWKMQIPYLSRHHRVVTFDGRGNGRSDRPDDPVAYGDQEQVDDAVAVLAATDTEHCVAAGLSLGGRWALMLGSQRPDLVDAIVAIAPAVPVGPAVLERESQIRWNTHIDDPQGWEKHNRWYWLSDYADWVEFFVHQIFSEPHSTKQREDGVRWGLQTDGRVLGHTYLSRMVDEATFTAMLDAIDRPVLVVHGSEDAVIAHGVGEVVAASTGGELLTIAGGGHGPVARDPVQVNLAIRDFVDRVTGASRPQRTFTRGRSRRPRALYVSSPIGLGHAGRDVAIADELRALHPDLEVDWRPRTR